MSGHKIRRKFAALGLALLLSGCGAVGGKSCSKADATVVIPKAVAQIEAKGVTDDLGPLLTPDPAPEGWLISYVTEKDGSRMIAASKPGLVNQPMTVLQGQGEFPRTQGTGIDLTGPEGMVFTVWTAWDVACTR